MQYLQSPLLLAEQAFSVLYYYWPVTLVLVILFIIALTFKSPFVGSRTRFCRRHLLVFLPLVLTLLIIVLGVVMEHPSDSPNLAPGWPSYVLLALLIIQLATSIWVIWLMKGYRLFSIFTVVLELWFALACAFITGMSVTGDWL